MLQIRMYPADACKPEGSKTTLQHFLIKILNRLGKIYRKMGQYEKALSGLKRSQDIKADINDFEYIGYTFLELSYVLKLENGQQEWQVQKKQKKF